MGLHPSPALVAYNALARYFEGAKPAGKKRLSRQIICYRFHDRGGKLLAAVWNYGEAKGIMLDLSGMEVRDLFGNRIDDTTLQNVTRAPFYLFPGTLTEQAFQARLESLNPIRRTPVSISAAARFSARTVRIGIHNDSDAPVSMVIGFRGEGLRTKRLEHLDLAPGVLRTVALSVCRDSEAQGAAEVMFYLNRAMFRHPVKLWKNNVRRAGEPIDLQSADGILRGSATIELEAEKLIMTFKVADQTDAGVRGKRYFWESDSIELFLDRNPDEFFQDGEISHPERYRKGTFRLFLLPRDPPGDQLFVTGEVLRREDIAVFSKTDGNGYVVRVELPRNKVLTASGRLGLNIKINDAVSSTGKTVRSANFVKFPAPHLERFSFNIIDFNGK